jgi:hypothetical protein
VGDPRSDRALGYEEIAAFGDNPYAGHWFAKRL